MLTYKCLPRLKKVREAKGLSQADLAALSGYHEFTIRRAEGGVSNRKGIKAQTASELAQALGVKLDDLLPASKPTLKFTQAHTRTMNALLNYRHTR